MKPRHYVCLSLSQDELADLKHEASLRWMKHSTLAGILYRRALAELKASESLEDFMRRVGVPKKTKPKAKRG